MGFVLVRATPPSLLLVRSLLAQMHLYRDDQVWINRELSFAPWNARLVNGALLECSQGQSSCLWSAGISPEDRNRQQTVSQPTGLRVALLPYHMFTRGQGLLLQQASMNRVNLVAVHGDLRPLHLTPAEWRAHSWSERGDFRSESIRRARESGTWFLKSDVDRDLVHMSAAIREAQQGNSSRYIEDSMTPLTPFSACPIGKTSGRWRSDGKVWAPILPHPCHLAWETLCFDCYEGRRNYKTVVAVEAQQPMLEELDIVLISESLDSQLGASLLVKHFCSVHRQRPALVKGDGYACVGDERQLTIRSEQLTALCTGEGSVNSSYSDSTRDGSGQTARRTLAVVLISPSTDCANAIKKSLQGDHRSTLVVAATAMPSCAERSVDEKQASYLSQHHVHDTGMRFLDWDIMGCPANPDSVFDMMSL
eukprot:scaffold1025_cov381-Prasinococcus_capsulatus_cf.AAC.1